MLLYFDLAWWQRKRVQCPRILEELEDSIYRCMGVCVVWSTESEPRAVIVGPDGGEMDWASEAACLGFSVDRAKVGELGRRELGWLSLGHVRVLGWRETEAGAEWNEAWQAGGWQGQGVGPAMISAQGDFREKKWFRNFRKKKD